MLRVTLAQINPTIGDIQGNIALMRQAAAQAAAEQAQLVVFPELSLTAYHPADLLEDTHFLARVNQGLAELAEATRAFPDLHWVVGAPTPAQGPGKGLHNSLLVIQNGEVLLSYAKQLLPTYNIFDEARYFASGPDRAPILRVCDARIGFLICEDGWNDAGLDYPQNPLQRLAEAAPDLVISINASPSNLGKRAQRHAVFGDAVRRHGFPLLFVNQIGGHDQVVFDGASFAATPEGGVVFEARRFEEDVRTLQFAGGQFAQADGSALPAVPAEGLPTMAFYRQQIVLGLRDYMRRCGFKRIVVGSSGGIDSALTLALAVEAVGADNVVGITMPSRWSSNGSVDDSVDLCRNLGIALHHHPIAELVAEYHAQYEKAFGAPLTGLAAENQQSRIRGVILMEYSNANGHLLLTTGNKSEVSVGYCTLYGDTNGGLGLLGDLYKTEVFDLSRHVNEAAGRELIPQIVIDKPPSAELAPDQKDEDSLPPYPVLDEILKYFVEGPRLPADEYARAKAFVEQLGATAEGSATIARVRRLVRISEYKRRQAPPLLRLRPRAFGAGRQMPIAGSYE